jgi:hypothetical protein
MPNIMSDQFQVLPGLPPHGEPARVFSATGTRLQSEGLVVRFTPSGAPAWVGNFIPGTLSNFQFLTPHPNGHDVIIIVGGQGYIVDPASHQPVKTFGGAIVDAFMHPTATATVLNHQNLCFEAIGPSGRIWLTRRISWDGMRSVVRSGTTLTGEAWKPGEDTWHPFCVDLQTSAVEGGSYSGPA